MCDRYRADVARHRIGIVCISEARDAGLVRTTCARQQCLGILAAVHESGNGPSRHFAASLNLVSIGGVADIGCGSDWMPRWGMTHLGHEQF